MACAVIHAARKDAEKIHYTPKDIKWYQDIDWPFALMLVLTFLMGLQVMVLILTNSNTIRFAGCLNMMTFTLQLMVLNTHRR